MHKYKFTNTHKCGCEKGRSEALEHRKLIKVGLSKMYLRSVQHKLKEVWALKEFLKYWICIMEVFIYSLLMHYFLSNLRKPEQAVADHMPFITVSDKAFPQMVPKRPYAYCVHVNVYSSKFEHNLKYYFEGLI